MGRCREIDCAAGTKRCCFVITEIGLKRPIQDTKRSDREKPLRWVLYREMRRQMKQTGPFPGCLSLSPPVHLCCSLSQTRPRVR